jgi:hypothetical protein
MGSNLVPECFLVNVDHEVEGSAGIIGSDRFTSPPEVLGDSDDGGDLGEALGGVVTVMLRHEILVRGESGSIQGDSIPHDVVLYHHVPVVDGVFSKVIMADEVEQLEIVGWCGERNTDPAEGSVMVASEGGT